MQVFQQFYKGRNGEITINNIMIFVDMECYKEVEFKYRVGSANDFSRIWTKNAVIFPASLNNNWFDTFLVSKIKFMFTQKKT